MTTVPYEDIQTVLDSVTQLEHARHNGHAFAIQAGAFVDRDAAKLSALLQELAFLRSHNAGGVADYAGTNHFLAEGTSETSAEEALANALSNAAHFFSQHHDVVLTLSRLGPRPGGGFIAVVEIHITLMKHTPTLHVEPPDVQALRLHDEAFRKSRKDELEQAAHMVFDHFRHLKTGSPTAMPASFMVNITDANLLNKMIERQFFKSTHPVQRLSQSGLSLEEEPFQLLVRARPPDAKPKPEPE